MLQILVGGIDLTAASAAWWEYDDDNRIVAAEFAFPRLFMGWRGPLVIRTEERDAQLIYDICEAIGRRDLLPAWPSPLQYRRAD